MKVICFLSTFSLALFFVFFCLFISLFISCFLPSFLFALLLSLSFFMSPYRGCYCRRMWSKCCGSWIQSAGVCSDTRISVEAFSRSSGPIVGSNDMVSRISWIRTPVVQSLNCLMYTDKRLFVFSWALCVVHRRYRGLCVVWCCAFAVSNLPAPCCCSCGN